MKLPIISVRAMLMTAGQLASYDQAKQLLINTGLFKDGPVTHFTYVLGSTIDPSREDQCC